MTVTINGTTGIAGVDGSAGTPAVQGADTNTGMFFPAADTIAFATAGTEDMRIDSSGNVGIGQTPVNSRRLTATTSGQTDISIVAGSTNYAQVVFGYTGADAKGAVSYYNADNSMAFYTNSSERMRIDGNGNVYVGAATSRPNGGKFQITYSGSGIVLYTAATSTQNALYFENPNGIIGSITTTGSSTNYATSSDYRLKNTITPMTGALAKVALLKPVTYKWNVDGSDGQGFIAHELQEVVPSAVTGDKDELNEDGSPNYQMVDKSALIPLLTAAIQEQQAIITSLTDRITALENK